MPVPIASVPYAEVLVQGANATFQITANSTGGNSGIGTIAPDFVLGASVSGLWWSTDGTITIKRGANTLMTLNGSGVFSDAQGFRALEIDAAATLVITTTSANATVIVELKKIYS